LERLAESIAAIAPTSGKRISPELLARDEDITLSFGSYAEAFDGLLEWKRGRFHIYCNLDRLESQSSARTRFTLGHELGHYFIDEHRRGLESGQVPSHGSWVEFVSELRVEQEADAFAAALLMPRERFLPLAAAGTGLPGILVAAEALGVSATAAALRYVRLDFGRAAVIRWRPDGSRAWRHTAASWRLSGIAGGGPRSIADLPSDSPTAMVFSDEASRGVQSKGSTLSFWFGRVQGGSTMDAIIHEQAIRLGRYGVLTVLVPEGT